MEQKNNLLKKIHYRARYRSTKEADYIFKGFIELNQDSLSLQELQDYSSLLEQEDPILFDWIYKITPVPASYNTDVLQKLRIYALDVTVSQSNSY